MVIQREFSATWAKSGKVREGKVRKQARSSQQAVVSSAAT